MTIYIEVLAKAALKIQDPYDEATIEDAKELTRLTSPYEMCEEEYSYKVIDAD